MFSCPARLSTLSVVYRQGRSTIFRMPIYPMLNRWNANPMTPNPGLWLVESNEDSYEYWWEPISYTYLSNVKSYEYWWAEYFVLRQATPSDLNVVNHSALCPVDHECTLDRFWVTTYPLTQSLGGTCCFDRPSQGGACMVYSSEPWIMPLRYSESGQSRTWAPFLGTLVLQRSG